MPCNADDHLSCTQYTAVLLQSSYTAGHHLACEDIFLDTTVHDTHLPQFFLRRLKLTCAASIRVHHWFPGILSFWFSLPLWLFVPYLNSYDFLFVHLCLKKRLGSSIRSSSATLKFVYLTPFLNMVNNNITLICMYVCMCVAYWRLCRLALMRMRGSFPASARTWQLHACVLAFSQFVWACQLCACAVAIEQFACDCRY